MKENLNRNWFWKKIVWRRLIDWQTLHQIRNNRFVFQNIRWMLCFGILCELLCVTVVQDEFLGLILTEGENLMLPLHYGSCLVILASFHCLFRIFSHWFSFAGFPLLWLGLPFIWVETKIGWEFVLFDTMMTSLINVFAFVQAFFQITSVLQLNKFR